MVVARALTAAFGLSMAVGALAQQPARPEQAYPYPFPGASSLVFQGNAEGRWQLYRMEVASGTVTRLHSSPGNDTHPAVSPDGRRIAFISNRDGNDEVYMLDVASGRARAVSPHPGKDGHPRWSRDGRWLVFNRTFDPADREGDGDSAIIRVRPDGSGLSVISDTPRVETFASFSPDGRQVAFVEWFPNEAGERNRNGEIVVVDIASGRRRNLTSSPAFDGHPIWGPSQWIYFNTVLHAGTPRAETVVHRIRADGTGLQRLGAADGLNDLRAVPDPAERILFYNLNRGDRVSIERMRIPPGAG